MDTGRGTAARESSLSGSWLSCSHHGGLPSLLLLLPLAVNRSASAAGWCWAKQPSHCRVCALMVPGARGLAAGEVLLLGLLAPDWALSLAEATSARAGSPCGAWGEEFVEAVVG
jgi:hypothetical protein